MPRLVDISKDHRKDEETIQEFDIPASTTIVLYGVNFSPLDLVNPLLQARVFFEIAHQRGWRLANSFLWKGDTRNTVQPQMEFDYRTHTKAGERGRIRMVTNNAINARLTVDFNSERSQ